MRAEPRPRVSRRSVTAAMVLALHAALLAILWTSPSPPPWRYRWPVAVRLDLLPLAAATPHPVRSRAAPAARLRNRRQTPSVPRRGGAAVRARLPAQAHLFPAIRWLAALRRAARTIDARRVAPAVPIGFPRADPFRRAARRRSWDGWDRAVTHRIQRLRTGGLAVTLNDHCAIDFEPFPLIGCALGKIPVPGDLFKHMRHRSAGGLP